MPTFAEQIRPYQQLIEDQLSGLETKAHISLFYDPIRYFLKIPGKRIRPLLVLLCAEVFGLQPQKAARVAAAVELLHNFSLVHDDIMDRDALRRGQKTIHEKWDVATAILAGDGLMGFAFQYLLRSESPNLVSMTRRFTDTMLLICEGQGLDKMFESGMPVSEPQYMEMIANKTAVLLQLACALGALSAGASEAQTELAGKFGYAMGMGFQIQDDLLDVMADSAELGKKAGSDLEMHKQTICTLRLQQHNPQLDIYNLGLDDLRQQLAESGVLTEIEQLFNTYFETASQSLAGLPQGTPRDLLKQLLNFVLHRKL